MVEFQLPKLTARVRFPSLAPFQFILGSTLILISGCATIEQMPTVSGQQAISGRQVGIYHKVKKGETLWRIAQAYSVNVDDLVQANKIPNIAQLEVNQLIFIPGAAQAQSIPVAELEPTAGSVKDNEFGWPLHGKVLSYFAQRDSRFNSNGINIQGQAGDQVIASRSGKVVFSDYLSGYASTVIVDHQDGYSTVYAQNGRLLVSLGQTVNKGTPLAEVADQGSLTHLHFEIRKNTMADNPLYYLSRAEEVR